RGESLEILEVVHVEDLTGLHHVPYASSLTQRSWERLLPLDPRLPRNIGVGGKVNEFTVEPIQMPVDSVTKPHGVSSDRLEDRLDIRRRSRNNAEDLTRRRLLIQSFTDLRMGCCEGAILLLQLGEQPDVLDRDHSLVGKGLKQGDLFSREATSFAASDPYRPDGPVVSEQGDDPPTSEAGGGSGSSLTVSQPGIRVRISDIERRTVPNGSLMRSHGFERFREDRPHGGITC